MSEATIGKKRLPLRRAGCIIPEDPKAEQMEPAALSGKGTVYSYTIVHQQLPFSVVQVPYAIVIVALEEGCQTHGVVTGNLDSVAVGAPIEVYFEKVREDDEGNDLIVNKFRIVQK